MWVARDKDGTLIMFHEKPIRRIDYWGASDDNEVFTITEGLFPNLKWEDEPIEVKLYSDAEISEIKSDSYKDGYDSGYDACLDNEI